MQNENKPSILLNWQISELFGWGIAGSEIFTYLALMGKFQPVMGFPIQDQYISGIDNLRKSLLMPSFIASNDLVSQLTSFSENNPGQTIKINLPVVHALGNQFSTGGFSIEGQINVGRLVFEVENFQNYLNIAEKYDAFIVASQWNYDVLRRYTDKPIYLNHEGVDTTKFYPSPKLGLFDQEDFVVFSGGKIEYRKAQDLVLEVFKRFSNNKNDVKLVTAWQSIYSFELSQGFKGVLEAGLSVDANLGANIKQWAVDNGISQQQIIDLGQVPHQMMPAVLREMDCAIQLSRAEGGTNFVAMECMASGLPTLLSECTGHLDIMGYPNAIPVKVSPQPVAQHILGAQDWREADVEDAVEKLEALYAQKKLHGTSRSSDHFPRSWMQHSIDFEKFVLTLTA
jgi:glycosyltransferase involved in cell wall biosynthesis